MQEAGEREAQAQVQAVREESERHQRAGYSVEHSVEGRSAVPPPPPHPFVGTHGAPHANIVAVAAERSLSGISFVESETEESTPGVQLEDSFPTVRGLQFFHSTTARADLGRRWFGRDGPPPPLDVLSSPSPRSVYTSSPGSPYTPRSAPLLSTPRRSPGLLLPKSGIRRHRTYNGEYLVNDTLLLSATLSPGTCQDALRCQTQLARRVLTAKPMFSAFYLSRDGSKGARDNVSELVTKRLRSTSQREWAHCISRLSIS